MDNWSSVTHAQPLAGSTFDCSGDGLDSQYAAALLEALGAHCSKPESVSSDSALIDWAESGLIPLTGDADKPPLQGPGCIPSCARGALSMAG
jgi:hypothetical protein